MPTVDISILIPCFDKEQYIDECIESISQQTVKPREIILAHDGCTEPMAHAKATTIIFNSNRGVSKVRDELVRFSRGQLLLFLDADDKLAPDYLEKMVNLITKVDIVYPNIFWWYGNKWGDNRLDEAPEKIVPKDFFHTCKIPITCLMKKDVYTKLGGFRDFEKYEDWDFWLRALVEGFKFKKANTMLYYRQYPESRNRIGDKDKKRSIYHKIISQYELKRGKICLKN